MQFQQGEPVILFSPAIDSHFKVFIPFSFSFSFLLLWLDLKHYVQICVVDWHTVAHISIPQAN